MSDLEAVTCGKCGVVFGMPSKMLAERREDKETFYCPNGHARVFKRSTSERLQESLDAERASKKRLVTEAYDYARDVADERDRLRRSNASLRGALTKAKRQRDGVTATIEYPVRES